MKGNILRQIEVEDIVFFSDNQYDPMNRKKYLEVFNDMVAQGRLTGNFCDMKWMGYSGIKRYGIDFALDQWAYNMHFGKRFGIPYLKMQDMLRCYVIYNIGTFIFPTINAKVELVCQICWLFMMMESGERCWRVSEYVMGVLTWILMLIAFQ